MTWKSQEFHEALQTRSTFKMLEKMRMNGLIKQEKFFLIDGYPRNMDNFTGWFKETENFSTVVQCYHLETSLVVFRIEKPDENDRKFSKKECSSGL
jgi:hypothetical protein